MGQPKRRDVNGFTPTQARIAAILEDGAWHSRKELCAAIDEEATANNLGPHLTEMRRIIEKRSEIIICRMSRETGIRYRLAQLVASAENG